MAFKVKNLFGKLALTATASALLLGGFVSNSYSYEQNKDYKYIVLHVNDTHGHFFTDRHGGGGFAAVKTIVENIRKENPGVPVLLLSGGDFNTGTPESDLQHALPDITAMNDLKFDAIAVGNHEFDVGQKVMEQQKAELKVPLISSNIIYRDPRTGVESYFYRRYVWEEKDGLKFLIIGNTTPSAKWTSNPKNLKNFELEDPTRAFLNARDAAESRHGKPDVIISVTHLGLYFNGQHGAQPYGDYGMDVRLGKKDGADLYVTGHSHVIGCVQPNGEPVPHYQPGDACTPPKTPNGKYLFQAGKWNRYVGEAVYNFKNGVSTLESYKLIPVNQSKKVYVDGKKTYQIVGKPVAQDPELYAKLKKFQDEGGKQLQVVVGHLSEDLIPTRFGQTKIGTFIANAFRVKAGADLAILNSGGIRDALHKGNVTYRDILVVTPFHNTLVTVELTGKQLEDYINTVVYYNDGGRPQYSGVTFKVGKDKKIYDVQIDGKPIDLNKSYKLCVLSFQADGGDRYPVISKNPTFTDTGYNDAQSIVEYFKDHPDVDVSKIVVQGPGANWNPTEPDHISDQ